MSKREERLKAGLCTVCGKKRDLPGRKMCTACLARNRLSIKKRHDLLLSENRCPVCGNRNADNRFIICAACRKYAKEKREAMNGKTERRSGIATAIECVETGERFETITVAAKAKGYGPTSICDSYKSGRATHGVHWRMIEDV